MVRFVVSSLFVIAACGRVAFDGVALPVDDAPGDGSAVGHDEDGDGLDDSVDPCPHIAGDAGDGDNDGLGDACDFVAGAGGERIRGFWPLTPGNHPFTSLGPTVQQLADSVRFTGVNQELRIAMPFANARFELGFEILATFGTGQHQIACGVVGTDPYYFVELNDHMGTTNLSITAFEQAGYYSVGEAFHTGIHPGVGLLRFDATTSPQQMYAVAGWTGELYEASAVTPGYTGGNELLLVLNGLDVVLTYVVIFDH